MSLYINNAVLSLSSVQLLPLSLSLTPSPALLPSLSLHASNSTCCVVLNIGLQWAKLNYTTGWKLANSTCFIFLCNLIFLRPALFSCSCVFCSRSTSLARYSFILLLFSSFFVVSCSLYSLNSNKKWQNRRSLIHTLYIYVQLSTPKCLKPDSYFIYKY